MVVMYGGIIKQTLRHYKPAHPPGGQRPPSGAAKTGCFDASDLSGLEGGAHVVQSRLGGTAPEDGRAPERAQDCFGADLVADVAAPEDGRSPITLAPAVVDPI